MRAPFGAVSFEWQMAAVQFHLCNQKFIQHTKHHFVTLDDQEMKYAWNLCVGRFSMQQLGL